MKKKNLLMTTIAIFGLATITFGQTLPSYLPSNGLVGWWPFNGNANDESLNGNNGIVIGSTLSIDRFGNSNKAYNFDGVSNRIDVQHSASLSIFGNQSSSSISLWCYGNIDWSGELIGKGFHSVNVGIYGNKYLSLNFDSQSYQYGLYDFSTLNSVRCPNGYFTPNQWYHIVFVRSSIIKVYVNGVDVSTAQNNSGWLTNYNLVLDNTIMSFGCRNVKDDNNVPFHNFFFNGKIDDIGIWNRSLTQEEISILYNATNCSNNLSISPENNQLQIGSAANFVATTSDTFPSYVWQSDLGQGFQTLNDYGNYSGVNTNSLSISNVQLSEHNQPIRVISTSGECIDTSNVATINITDTCIVTINDTITTLISVTDTLVINTLITGLTPPNNSNTIKVFPNPANSHLTIDFGDFASMNGYNLKITNSIGQIVFTTPINQQSSYIDLSTWGGNGIYFVQIIDSQNNTIENRKIVLQ